MEDRLGTGIFEVLNQAEGRIGFLGAALTICHTRMSRKEACGLDSSYLGGVERGNRNVTFGILCTICYGLTCDIAAVTKGIPHLLA